MSKPKLWNWSYSWVWSLYCLGQWLGTFSVWWRPYLERVQFDFDTRWYTLSVQLDRTQGLSLLGYAGGTEPWCLAARKSEWR